MRCDHHHTQKKCKKLSAFISRKVVRVGWRKGGKLNIYLKKELIYSIFGTLKQQNIKIKANKIKKQAQIVNHEALHF